MKIITIGRSSQCDIVLSSDGISRIHAELTLINGQYVYRDMSTNGTNIGGRVYHNEKVVIAPGTTVLMANSIPLPWDKIYQILPPNINDKNIQESPTKHYYNVEHNNNDIREQYTKDELNVALGILAFFIPLLGFILYFVWKNDTPKRANKIGIISLVGFIFNFIVIIL